MLLLKQNNLGEQAINKIATLALSNQLNEAKHLDVRVKTDPALLAKGKLASLLIDGRGLVTRGDLKMQQFYLEMDEIAVSPFKALMGNIELTQPTQGIAKFILTEEDFNCGLNRKSLRDRLGFGGEMPSLACHLLATGQLAIALQDKESTTLFNAIPKLQEDGEGIILTHIQQVEGRLSSQGLKILKTELEETLNLRNFGMTGICLQIKQFQLHKGCINLHATAKMTHFPAK